MLVASGKGIYLCIGIPLTSSRPETGVAVVPISDPDATFEVCGRVAKGPGVKCGPRIPEVRVEGVSTRAAWTDPNARAASRRAS